MKSFAIFSYISISMMIAISAAPPADASEPKIGILTYSDAVDDPDNSSRSKSLILKPTWSYDLTDLASSQNTVLEEEITVITHNEVTIIHCILKLSAASGATIRVMLNISGASDLMDQDVGLVLFGDWEIIGDETELKSGYSGSVKAFMKPTSSKRLYVLESFPNMAVASAN